MKRLAQYTISGLRRTLDLHGRTPLPDYGFLVLGALLMAGLTLLIWAVFGFWPWPLIVVNAWTLLACVSAGIRRLRDAGQHVGWAIAHGASLLLIVAAYGLLLADIEMPRPEMQPGFSGVIVFVVLFMLTMAGVALLQLLMLAPVGVFIITTPVMAYLCTRPSATAPAPVTSLPAVVAR